MPTTVIVFDSYFVSPLCLYMARPLSSGLLSHFLKSLYCYQIISDGSPQIENGKRLNWPAIIKFNFLCSTQFSFSGQSILLFFCSFVGFFLRRVCRRSGWKKGLFSIRTKYKFLKVYLRLERNGGACLSCVCVCVCVARRRKELWTLNMRPRPELVWKYFLQLIRHFGSVTY